MMPSDVYPAAVSHRPAQPMRAWVRRTPRGQLIGAGTVLHIVSFAGIAMQYTVLLDSGVTASADAACVTLDDAAGTDRTNVLPFRPRVIPTWPTTLFADAAPDGAA